MRKARVTFKSAYHHITSRSFDGKPIFKEEFFKNYLLQLIKKYSLLTRTRIFAYCIMDNHYHLIVQNSNLKMHGFMRENKFVRTKDEVISEFENINHIKIADLDLKNEEARNLRNQLLIILRDEAGLSYKEINKICLFQKLKFSYIITL